MTTTYELYTNENGTPKAVEGKAPAILERVEALEENSLPKTGGTITGTIYGSGGMIRGKSDDTDVWISGGTNSTANPYIQLNGGSKSSNAGVIEVVAKDATKSSSLRMKPDGMLTWGGNNVITSEGGTMTGNISLNKDVVIRGASNDVDVRIYGGNGYGNGAYIGLRGKDHSEKGIFTLCATDGTSNKILMGKPDGSLIWGSNNIVRSVNGTSADASGNVTISVPATPKAYVTTTWKSGNNWYRKWSDGYIEQGGTVSPTFSGTEATVTVNTAFARTAYFFDWVSNEEQADNYYEHSVISKTTSKVTILDSSLRSGTYSITWYACGY